MNVLYNLGELQLLWEPELISKWLLCIEGQIFKSAQPLTAAVARLMVRSPVQLSVLNLVSIVFSGTEKIL